MRNDRRLQILIRHAAIAVFGLVAPMAAWGQSEFHTQFGAVSRIAFNNSDNGGVAAADIDGDGLVDVVTATRAPDRLRVYLHPGTSGGLWTEIVVPTTQQFLFDVATLDLDVDGDIDLLVASQDDDTIAWYENVNGDGSAWSAHVITSTAVGVRWLFPADMDGDGDVDIAAAHQAEGVTAWYENTAGDASAWSFHLVSTYSLRPEELIAADFDLDGDMDLVTTSRDPQGVYWLENLNGVATSWRLHNITTNIIWPRTVAVGDFDGDGDLDAVSGSRIDDMIAWYENNGATPAGFTMHVLVDNGVPDPDEGSCNPCAPECGFADGALKVLVTDVDLDGDPDIVAAATHADRIFWFENDAPNAAGRFTIRNLANPGNPREIVLADIDGDDDLDLAYFNRLEALPGPLRTPGEGVFWVENVRRPGLAAPFAGFCSDGVDNDADCLIDYPADPSCVSPIGREAAECSDGVDNDGDGLVDLDDPTCAGDPRRSSERVPTYCGLGPELALAIPLLLWRRRRHRLMQA